jgi:hypothetical protein
LAYVLHGIAAHFSPEGAATHIDTGTGIVRPVIVRPGRPGTGIFRLAVRRSVTHTVSLEASCICIRKQAIQRRACYTLLDPSGN